LQGKEAIQLHAGRRAKEVLRLPQLLRFLLGAFRAHRIASSP
jgi:hypothetical protein